MWTRKHGLTGNNLRVLESLAKFCLQFYFKIYFDVKVRHLIVDAPYHVLTGLRILRTQPKKVRDAITFYVRTGAWYSHPECLILSLLASPIISERKFAIDQVLKLRGGREFSDNSLRPRFTSKLNLSATSLPTLTLKLVTESAAAECDQEGRDGFIRANNIGKRCCSLGQKYTLWLHSEMIYLMK